MQNSLKPEKKCKSGTSRGTAPETDCAVHSLRRRAGFCFPLVQPWSLPEAFFTLRCRWSCCTSRGAVLTQPWCLCGCCEQALGPSLSFFLCSCHQLISCCLESKGEEKRRKPFILGKTAPLGSLRIARVLATAAIKRTTEIQLLFGRISSF